MEMKAKAKTLGEIRIAGIKALVQRLGVVGAIRFLQYEDKGYGDYSLDRHRWLDDPDLEQIVDEIKKTRK